MSVRNDFKKAMTEDGPRPGESIDNWMLRKELEQHPIGTWFDFMGRWRMNVNAAGDFGQVVKNPYPELKSFPWRAEIRYRNGNLKKDGGLFRSKRDAMEDCQYEVKESRMTEATAKTRALAGAAYLDKRNNDSILTHSYVDGSPTTLCRKAKASSVLDDMYATDEDAPPTCPTCRKIDPRFR